MLHQAYHLNQLKRLVQNRMGTLNVGTVTGRGKELVGLMERSRVSVVCAKDLLKGEQGERVRGGETRCSTMEQMSEGKMGRW